MANKSYLDIDFSTRVRKRWLQTFFYMSSKVRSSSALILCGPDVISHYNDYKMIRGVEGYSKYIKLYIAELDTKTYNQNIIDLSNIPNLNYSIVNADIITCKIKRFVDLDFCKNLSSTISIVDKIYKKMTQMNTKFNKHILVTFSVNRLKDKTIEDDINSLCTLFGITNNFSKLKELPHSHIMKHKTVDCMYSTYRDGTPMCTFSYQFK